MCGACETKDWRVTMTIGRAITSRAVAMRFDGLKNSREAQVKAEEWMASRGIGWGEVRSMTIHPVFPEMRNGGLATAASLELPTQLK